MTRKHDAMNRKHHAMNGEHHAITEARLPEPLHRGWSFRLRTAQIRGEASRNAPR
jgi:hypothetical protein